MTSLGVSGNQPSGSLHKMPSSLMNGEEDEDITFDSPQQEASHYREKYRRILDMLDETRAELDEFQSSSKELEDELEKELQATERQQAELKEKIKRLEAEKEEWRSKHVALQKLHSSTTGAMQREMDNLRSERDKTLIALRDLEMGNDELERNERVAVSSLLDLESKYNRAIEEKTLLEQEVVQKQDLEAECQRLKDDVRDANNEIAILRDQLIRTTVPTPPSSVSVSMSPVQDPARDLPPEEIPPAPLDKSASQSTASTPEPPSRISRLPRSTTASSIPTLSPAAKRYSTRQFDSPLGPSALSRSTTSRNLAQSAASPALSRHRHSVIGSPARVAPVNPNAVVKTKGFKLLHELQARLKATNDELGMKVPKRLVSATLSRRTASSATTKSTASSKNAEERPTQLTASQSMSTPIDTDKSGATFLSPNSWVLVSDNDDTPTNKINTIPSFEPSSPLETNYRSASSASSKPLPTRPGIPSPLAANLSRSTNASRVPRPPSRGPTSAFTARSKSRQDIASSRPMSPSMLPQPTRTTVRSQTPTSGHTISASTSALPSSRPSSRSAHRSLGRGPPPVSKQFADAQPLRSSVSRTPSALKRSARRSSLGGAEAALPPTGIPAPARSPGRPISVPVFAGTPPPVPRIPSHLRTGSKDKLGTSMRRATKADS